uniref:Uncharacterized protein n=1 Tax=Hyaloperonospora arabidopsidis (strain Emoy2) TaxID=559515 RepID=M4C3X8_HYAAE
MVVLDPTTWEPRKGFRRGRAALPASNCGRGRHKNDVNASLYRQPQNGAADVIVNIVVVAAVAVVGADVAVVFAAATATAPFATAALATAVSDISSCSYAIVTLAFINH